jgi:hypothetical protein
VQVIPANGFLGSVTITVTGLPSDVTVSPSSLVLSADSTGKLVFTAALNAAPSSSQISIKGASGSQQASTTLALNVIQTASPIARAFTTVGGDIERGFYDESRQLLFASNPNLNEVDVLSGKDLSVQARIPIAQPFGIDQMPDGNTLVVGTLTQGFYTINESTFAVTQYLAPNLSSQGTTTVLINPVAVANGKVLFIGKDWGVYMLPYGGQYIIEWDSNTGLFSMTMSFTPSGEVDNLKRSADHNWAIFAADKLYVYSSASDSFVSSINPVRADPLGIRDVAANPSGTQFAVVTAESVSFYDGSFNALGTVATTAGLFDSANISNTQYSSDGSLLYWELFGNGAAQGWVVDVLNTTNFTETGDVTSDYDPFPVGADLLWVDSTQRAFLAAAGGIGTVDCTALRTGPPTLIGGFPNPSAIPLNQAVTISFGNPQLPFGTSVTVNGQLAPIESDNVNNSPFLVQVPASSAAGPVNIVFTQPDGETLVEPMRFSYGVDVAAPTSTLVPPIGNPTLGVFGFGMWNGQSAPTNVTVGGQTATNVTVNSSFNSTAEEILLPIPNGTPGPADITVTGTNGTGTLKSAVTYIPSATIIPASGLLQLLYDPHRSLLYALQSTEIQVLDPTNLQWKNPLKPGNSGGIGYVSMAITPDGTQLLVLDNTANTLTAFDPDNQSQSVTTALTTAAQGVTLQSVAATNTGKAFIGRLNGDPIEFNLATNTSTLLNLSGALVAKFAATPDGNYMAGVVENNNSGTIVIWHSADDSFTLQNLVGTYWVDLAISPDGNLSAAVAGDLDSAGVAVGFFDQDLHFLNATVYPDLAPPDQPFSAGVIFSASGLTLLSPLGDSVDFFSTETATLNGRLLMPEALPLGYVADGVIALDPNQQTIYAISASGLTVATLPSVVDQIAPFPWPYIAGSSHAVPFAAGAQPRVSHALPK